ncbi:MAG: XRE family transcriptional regulator [Spirochaetales bacterium]|nr:XRE family transcriptional regulator [Spirochaetales bacterium]
MEKPPIIGKHIQKLRNAQSLTLNVLSERSGVSKAMLSQIEADKVNPTVATVWKIAQGLGVEIQALLGGENRPKRIFQVSRYENITKLDTIDEGVHIHVLSPLNLVEDLEMYIITLEPHAALHSDPHFPKSEEYLTVLKGRIRVKAGESTAELRKGDFISYHCDIEHTIENTGNSEAKVHLVVRYKQQISATS